ncbi:MAG: type VI secretion system lipoprotein TssJ [Xanthomonadales bacterium]|nr:type VI secretion system lipoprotein TssJ [Xanthomonadales bacterium]
MLRVNRSIFVLLLAFLALCVSGCASKPKPTELEAVVRVATNVNPDRSGRPSPVVMWLYELKATAKFLSADYFALAARDSSFMSGEVVNRSEYQLGPGELLDFSAEIDPGAAHVGVVVAFRDLENARWRGVFDLTPNRRNRIEIRVDRLAVSIQETR